MATQPSAILPSNLTAVFATAENDLWVICNTIMDPFHSSTSLWHVTGSLAHWEMPCNELGWNGLFFPDDTSGFAAGNVYESIGTLTRWDGVSWSSVSMPASLRAGLILWMWMTNVENGWLIWEKPANFSRRLLQLDAGEWNIVAAPEGCEDTDPWRVVGDADYAIALDRPTPEDRFWELRDGSWSCRHLTGVGGELRQEGALVRTDGRVFVLVTDASTELSYLLEVTAAGVIRLSVPANIRAYALHDLGTTAPHYSMSR